MNLTQTILQEAMKREDKNSIPLIVELCKMRQYYSIPYLIKCMKKHYDGRETYHEKYGLQIENQRRILNEKYN